MINPAFTRKTFPQPRREKGKNSSPPCHPRFTFIVRIHQRQKCGPFVPLLISYHAGTAFWIQSQSCRAPYRSRTGRRHSIKPQAFCPSAASDRSRRSKTKTRKVKKKPYFASITYKYGWRWRSDFPQLVHTYKYR